MNRLIEYTQIFLLGSTGYSSLEIIYRGFTHWSMFIAGGICFAVLYHIFTVYSTLPLWKNCIIGSIVITCTEFVFGCIFNLALGWDVWDYSHFAIEFMGQICLLYTLIWFFLSAPILWIARGLKKIISR